HEALLLGAAPVADLGKSRCEHDGAANAAASASRNSINHRLLRHHQHGRVDAVRQLIDCGHAGPSVDLLGAAADQIDVALTAATVEVGEHGAADRARLGRSTHDSDCTRPHQASEPAHLR